MALEHRKSTAIKEYETLLSGFIKLHEHTILSHWKWVNCSSNCKHLDGYIKLFCLELSGKAVASNSGMNTPTRRNHSRLQSQNGKEQPTASPSPRVPTADTATCPSLPMPVLPQTLQLQNCKDTPQRQTQPLCTLALRRKPI